MNEPKDQHQIVKSHHKYEPTSRQYVAVSYEPQEFPKWKYHAHNGQAREVKNAEEEKRLGPEWQDMRKEANSAPTPPTDLNALHQKNKELEKQLEELKAKHQESAQRQEQPGQPVARQRPLSPLSPVGPQRPLSPPLPPRAKV